MLASLHLLAAIVGAASAASLPQKQPNFLIIVADDLGFSDTSPFGAEISTPWLDSLAKDGIRFTGYHTAAACAPTRSMLMSGTDNHLAGVGMMPDQVGVDTFHTGRPGYEGVLNLKVAAMPEIFQANGYQTFMAGKWHLGMSDTNLPHVRGFEQDFALLPGAGNHFNYQPYDENGKIAVQVLYPYYDENGVSVNHTTFPSPWYSSDVYTDKMLGYMKGRNTSKPFLAYLPFTAPHWPLQAPAEVIERYRGMYDDGPDVLHDKRLKKLHALGLVNSTANISPTYDAFGYKPWDQLNATAKAFESRKMETYAAMVEHLDYNIGRVITHLKEIGEYDNTFIFFSSDNGAEGGLLETKIPGLPEIFAKWYNNSYENIGKPSSFAELGPQWAQAATAPSFMYKTWATQGGIRCPGIVRWPAFQRPKDGVDYAFVTVMDVLPTMLEVAGIAHPAPTFMNRTVLAPRGRSWVPYLSGKVGYVHAETDVMGWELYNQAAIRQGRWKALFAPVPGANSTENEWQLYDLKADPGETKDLAKVNVDKLNEMLVFWATYMKETGAIINTSADSMQYFAADLKLGDHAKSHDEL